MAVAGDRLLVRGVVTADTAREPWLARALLERVGIAAPAAGAMLVA